MRTLYFSILVFFGLSTPAYSQTALPTQEVIFPHFAVGGGWETDLTLIAQGSETSAGSVIFIAQDGELLPLTVDGNYCDGMLNFNMIYRSARTFKLTGGTQTQAGWIVVSQVVSDTKTKGSINGILTFRYKAGGVTISQVGVPGVRETMNSHIPFDNTAGNLSAFAVSSVFSNTLEIKRYDEQGMQQEATRISLGDTNQRSLFVHEMFPNSLNRRGFLTIGGTQPFAVLALNVNNSNWSSSSALPAVLERQIEVTGSPTMPIRLILEGQFIHGVIETTPAVTNPITGVVVFKPSGGMLLYLHMNSFLIGTGEAVVAVGIAKISDWKLLNVNGSVKYLYENGTTVDGGTFHLYPLSSAQF